MYLFVFVHHYVLSDSLWPQRLQHTRITCFSLTSRFRSKSCPLNQWCYLATSSSAISLFFCLQSFQASGSLPMNSALSIRWPKCWSSASASVLPMNIQSWFPLGLTGWISLQSKGLSRVFSSTTVWKYQLFGPYPVDARCTCPTPECNKPTCSQTLTAKWPLSAKLSWLRTIAIEDDIFFFLFLSSSSRFLWHFALLIYYYVSDSY